MDIHECFENHNAIFIVKDLVLRAIENRTYNVSKLYTIINFSKY